MSRRSPARRGSPSASRAQRSWLWPAWPGQLAGRARRVQRSAERLRLLRIHNRAVMGRTDLLAKVKKHCS